VTFLSLLPEFSANVTKKSIPQMLLNHIKICLMFPLFFGKMHSRWPHYSPMPHSCTTCFAAHQISNNNNICCCFLSRLYGFYLPIFQYCCSRFYSATSPYWFCSRS